MNMINSKDKKVLVDLSDSFDDDDLRQQNHLDSIIEEPNEEAKNVEPRFIKKRDKKADSKFVTPGGPLRTQK